MLHYMGGLAWAGSLAIAALMGLFSGSVASRLQDARHEIIKLRFDVALDFAEVKEQTERFEELAERSWEDGLEHRSNAELQRQIESLRERLGLG